MTSPFLGKKSEIDFYQNVADIFHCASLEAEPVGHHCQVATQLSDALFDMVSNFSAFKCCEQWVGNPAPSDPLPFLQLMYFAA